MTTFEAPLPTSIVAGLGSILLAIHSWAWRVLPILQQLDILSATLGMTRYAKTRLPVYLSDLVPLRCPRHDPVHVEAQTGAYITQRAMGLFYSVSSTAKISHSSLRPALHDLYDPHAFPHRPRRDCLRSGEASIPLQTRPVWNIDFDLCFRRYVDCQVTTRDDGSSLR